MNENMTAVLIPLLTDATISTTGGPTNSTVVIGPVLNFIHRAFSIQAFADIYELGGTTPTVDVEGEWSIDKVSWRPFSADIASFNAAALDSRSEYTTRGNFGPFVRFNVRYTTQSGAGNARLTVVLNIRFVPAAA